MSENNKLLKTASFMAIATLLAKVCGMARDMLIAAFFSTGIEATAFITATKLPTMLFDIVIGGVISATFIPVFNSVMKKESRDAAMQFASKFITMILLITMLITLFGITFSDQLIYFLGPKLNAQTHDLARSLSSIMFPMIIFTGLAFSFVGILQSFGEYNIPSIISLVSNLAIILYFVVFGKKFGVYGLAVTMVIAWSLQVIIQIPSLKKFKFRYRPSLKFNDPNIKHTLMLAGPMLISTWVQPLYSIINSRLASGIANGSAVAVLEYANRLYTIVVGVFSFVVTNLIFPKLARANADQDKDAAKGLIATSLKAICIIILPLMAGFILLAKPITGILYGHGSMTSNDVSMTAVALTCYSTGMIGLAVNEILSKSFFSMQNSKTPMINAVISMIVNVILAYTLSHALGIAGLALATAGGSTTNALLNYICIRKYYKRLFTRRDIVSILKTAVSAVIMGVVVWALSELLGGYFTEGFAGSLCTGIICGASGVVVYFAVCYFIGVDEIRAIAGSLRKK